MFAGRCACTIALLAIGASCGGSDKKPRKPGDEGAESFDGRKIRKVRVVGNKAFKDAALVSGLANGPPTGRVFTSRQKYDPIELAKDKARIESYYKERGYFTVHVRNVDVKRVAGNLVDITFFLKEGPQTKIRSLTVKGAPKRRGFGARTLAKLSKLKVGDPVDYDEYSDAKSRIRGHLVRAGYAFAKVRGKVQVNRRIARADIVIKVDPGPRAVFGKTALAKAKGMSIPDESVRARLTYKAGEPFRTAQLVESRRRLYALGVFSTVNFEYDKQKRPEVADVTVRLAEGKRHEIKLGGGAGIDNTRYEIRGRAEYREKGFLMPLLSLKLEARPSFAFLRDGADASDLTLGLGFEASAGLTKQDFLSPLWQGDAKLTYTAREFNAYSIQGPRLVLGVVRKLFGDRLRLGLSWVFRVQTILGDELNSDTERAELGLPLENAGDKSYVLGVFQQSIAYDARDNPIAPRRGIYAEVRLEESGSYAGSTFDYVRVVPELRGYLSLGERIVFGARARFGRTLSGSVLPITERFFVGGASSQRGFGLQRLSPRIDDDLNQAPVGARAMVETSVEARVDLFELGGQRFGFATFVDGGESTRDPDDLKLSNMHWAVGFGLRIRTLIGPVRADIAWRRNRKGATELDPNDDYAWHISLGEAF